MTDLPPETRLAVLGPFFAAELHDGKAAPTAPWRPMRELVDDPAALARRVDAVRAALDRRSGSRRRAELRVAASVTHLGLVARVLSPVIGAASLGHRSLPAGLDDLWWQDRLGGPFPLSFRAPTPSATASPDAAATVLIGSMVEAVTRTVARRYHVSEQVVWGNVASAANTAARLAGESPDGTAGVASRARAAADALLADRRIAAGSLRSGPGFRRTSCCLMYRLASGPSAVCEDCVLTHPPGTGSL